MNPSSSSWLVGKALLGLLSTAGGALVLIGLILEYKSGNCGFFDSQSRKVKTGELLVLAGILMELVVGAILLARHAHEAKPAALPAVISSSGSATPTQATAGNTE